MTLPTVASLWIGGRLSYLERLCLSSFVDHGHPTVLYAYDTPEGVPDGVELRDANAVMPRTITFTHAPSGSPAPHADAFRYRMLAREDVIWVDADMLAMRPWDDVGPHLFGWEKPGTLVCNAVLGLPPDSPTLARLNALCAEEHPVPPWLSSTEQDMLRAAQDRGEPVHVSEMKWGVWGPSALTHFLKETGEIGHARPQMAFYPVSFRNRRDLLSPDHAIEAGLGPDCLGVHLWNRRLRRRLITHENGVPRPGSFLATMLDRHGIDPRAHPIPDEPPGPPPGRYAGRWRDGRPLARLRESPAAERRSARIEQAAEREGRRLTAPEAPLETGRVLILTAMKNEAPFILDWLAYHRTIGVDHVLVYTNDCTDPTVPILKRLETMGLVTHRENPFDRAAGEKPQHAALRDAPTTDAYQAADWVLTVDVDEYLNIHVGDGTIPKFLAAAGHPNVASFTWKFFGNAGVTAFEDRPIIEQFTRCAPEVPVTSRLGWGFKSMFRTDAPFARPGIHRPLDPYPARLNEIRWVNGSGRVMPETVLARGWRSTTQSLGYRLATLNHYVLRSAESFLVKRDRGRVNHVGEDQGETYWARRNFGTETDDRILARLPAALAERNRLMADLELARLHQEAVTWHRAKIAELKADPAHRTLYAAITRPDQPDALLVSKAEDRPRLPRPAHRLAPVAPIPGVETRAPAPRFAEIASLARERCGMFWQGDPGAVALIPVSDRLVVTFDDQRQARDEGMRLPADFATLAQDLGCSVLGVMATARHWYRDPFYARALEHLAAEGLFKRFEQVLFLGAGMGGFGALAHARVAPGARVLALAPQTTLDRALVPEETRWGWTAALDWKGPYADAAAPGVPARVVYDPRSAPEMAQVARLAADVHRLPAPWTRGRVADLLRETGGFREIIEAALTDSLSVHDLRAALRDRTRSGRHIRRLGEQALAAGKPDRAARLLAIGRRHGNSPALRRLGDAIAEAARPAAE